MVYKCTVCFQLQYQTTILYDISIITQLVKKNKLADVNFFLQIIYDNLHCEYVSVIIKIEDLKKIQFLT